MASIFRPNKYGNPRAQAQGDLPAYESTTGPGPGPAGPARPAGPAGPDPAGPEPTTRFRGRAGAAAPRPGRDFWDGLLPEGADLSDPSGRLARKLDYTASRQGGGGGGHDKHGSVFGGGGFGGFGSGFGGAGAGGGSMYTYMRPIQPDVDCLIEGTEVLVPGGGSKCIEDVRPGDAVIGQDGRTYHVERQWESEVAEELVEIRLWGGEVFTCTRQHMWPVFAWARTCHCGCGEPVRPGRIYVQNHRKKGELPGESVYVHGSRKSVTTMSIPRGHNPMQKLPAENLQVGDFMLVPRHFDEVKVDVTPGQARLLGYYLAEGTIDWGVQWCFGQHELDTWVADVERLLDERGVLYLTDLRSDVGAARVTSRYGRFKVEERPQLRGGYTEDADYERTRAAAEELKDWVVTHAGRGENEKQLSLEVMSWPLHLKEELLRGYFRGDGTQVLQHSKTPGKEGKSFYVSATTASKTLSRQLVLLLAQLGFPAQVYPVPESRNKNGFHYRIIIKGGEFPSTFADLVWGEHSRADQHERRNKISHRCMVDEGFVYVPITSIKIVENVLERAVYNITVDAPEAVFLCGTRLPVLTSNSPDRLSYPQTTKQANYYWRMYYKLDPVIGTCVDMISSMAFSPFELIGEGVNGEIKERLETMLDKTRIFSLLDYFLREWLVIGEVCPHLVWDDNEGIWTAVGFHDPDYIEVYQAPQLGMEDPACYLVPDPLIREQLLSDHPRMAQFRESLPPQVLASILSGQPLELDPTNFSFLARKLHPYQRRGTSTLSRLWRVLALEDAYASASIAVARRASAPVKAMLLGDPATGYIPDESKMADMEAKLAQAEMDPQGWIVTSYAAKADLWGAPDRVLNLRDHQDWLDQAKFACFGVSRGLIQNEVSYASAASGLNAMLQRLRSYRDVFENNWILPKFINLAIEMNDWTTSTEATASSIRDASGPGIIIKRTAQEHLDPNAKGPTLVRAKLQWERPLDPSIDSARLGAVQSLQGMGCRFSEQTLFALCGLDWEEEARQRITEARQKRQLIEDNPDVAVAPGMMPQSEDGMGGGGGGMPFGGDMAFGDDGGLGGEDFGGGDFGGGDDLGGGGGDLGGGDGGDLGGVTPPPAARGNHLLEDARGRSHEGDATLTPDAAATHAPATPNQAPAQTPAERARGIPEFVEALRRGLGEGDWSGAGRAGGLAERLAEDIQRGRLRLPHGADVSEAWSTDVRPWLLDEGTPVAWVGEVERQLLKRGSRLRARPDIEAALESELVRFEAELAELATMTRRRERGHPKR
jgi:hypothetical protein